jgi:hypothetical protein
MAQKLLGSGTHVDTDELRRQAATLSGVVDRLISAKQHFSAGAHLPDHAFGVLPQAAGSLSQYRTAVDDMLANADALIRAHQQGAINLRASADNYDGADQP